MSKFEFVKYEPTPTEKHLGIATVIIEDARIVAKFKIVPTKDGGTFPASASFKIGEKYVESLMLDSRMDDLTLKALIKEHVKLSPAMPSDPQPFQPMPIPEYDNDLMF